MALADTLQAHAKRRLGRPHFAYLRAIIEGLSTSAMAGRFLGADGAAEARDAHHALVDALRSVAMRHGAGLWERLAEGVELRRARAAPPSLDAWAEAAGLDPAEWGEAELLAMYYEAHPPGEAEQAEARTTAAQRRERLELLRALEARVGEAALPEHAVEGWFDAQTAQRLRGAGVATIGALQLLIAQGGRWYAAMEAIGQTKAAAIEAYLGELLPALPASAVAFAAVQAIEHRAELAARDGELLEASAVAAAVASPGVTSPGSAPVVVQDVNAGADTHGATIAAVRVVPAIDVDEAHASVAAEILPAALRAQLAASGLDGQRGRNRRVPSGLAARDDLDAAAAWLCARTGKPGTPAHVPTTYEAYLQQVRRLLLWCTGTRQVALSSMTTADCEAYIAFLGDIPDGPDGWISTARAAVWSPRWRPFAGQLTASSREQAVRTLSSLFDWLVNHGHYLQDNPWGALKLRQPDDPTRRPRPSRAFTPEAWAALIGFLEHPDMSPTGDGVQARQRRAERERMRFVLEFNECMGLRATELVSARVKHLAADGSDWTLHVHGKGSRNREVVVPPQAVRALEGYFHARGLGGLRQAPADAPLLAQLLSEEPMTYKAFYDAFRDYIRRAIACSTLEAAERQIAMQASTHWMRHTAAVRLDDRGTDAMVIKDHLGHANLETTMKYLRTQERRRRAQIAQAFS